MHLWGIDWVGVNAENGRKLLLSLVFVAVVVLVRIGLRALVGRFAGGTYDTTTQVRFWTRQGISLIAAVVLVLGLLSIWFNDPTRLATAFGLVSAGVAFALQQVITSLAGYLVILRGNTFTVGDRISMGGVRGDVMRLGFVQTTIMEMGQPPSVQGSDPAMWVRSRQFTGRIVTVSNSQIFSEPVYNYSRDFPFIWEEMVIPITYQADRAYVERTLVEAARLHATDPDTMAVDAKEHLQARFGVEPIDLQPRVYWRITDNWMELTVRFIVGTHRIRGAKDAMTRHIIGKLDEAGIGIASATYDIVGLPPLRLEPGRGNDASATAGQPS